MHAHMPKGHWLASVARENSTMDAEGDEEDLHGQ